MSLFSTPYGGRTTTGGSPSCENYYSCPNIVLHGNNFFTETHCVSDGLPFPEDAYAVTRKYCLHGNTINRTFCIGERGLAADPGDQPCVTCNPGEREVGGSCQACPTHYVCNGNSRVQERWCDAGSPPGDARLVSYQTCAYGSTVTTNTCVPPGGTTPADRPCGVSCGANQRPVNGRCEACPTYQVCSNGVTEDRVHCGSGSPPADNPCSGCSRTAMPSCSTGQSWTWDQGTCMWDSGSASAPSCPSGQQSTWNSSACAYGPCQACLPGQRLVGGSCQACPTYWGCSGDSRVETPWCYAGNPPADARASSYEACGERRYRHRERMPACGRDGHCGRSLPDGLHLRRAHGQRQLRSVPYILGLRWRQPGAAHLVQRWRRAGEFADKHL